MNIMEFEQFKAERIAVNRTAAELKRSVNRTAAGLKRSVQKKAVKYLKDVKGIDIHADPIYFRSYVINEKSIYGKGSIILEALGVNCQVEKTYKIPRSYIFPKA